MSICDVAIIRATQPLHILTFVEDGGKHEPAVEYNAQLTRSIMGFIKKETGVSLDVVYGVVNASTWKDETLFKEKLEHLETVARRMALPGYLHMDTERFTAITKALVDLYSEPGMKDQLESEIIIESLERDGKGRDNNNKQFQGALCKNHWIYDMPGIFESHSILSSHIISILSGEVPLQAKIGKDLGITHQTFNTPHDHLVSCVVVVLRHEHGYFGMEIQRQLECVANRDTSIHLVLTHLDECDHQFRDRANLPNLYQSSKVQEAVRMKSKKTGVLPSSISFVRNYVQETDADVISKLQHVRVLQRILSSCVDQEEKKLNQEQQERMYSESSKYDQNRRTLGPPTHKSVKAILAVLLMALMVAVMIKLCNLPPPA